ncbi:MAG: spermidine/putrescine ABC transporter substrate-binding protein [Anaerocolumna sp.]
MKKRIMSLLIVCTMILGLVGCNSEKSASSKEINLLAWAGIDDTAIAKLEELTGYKINYTSFSSLEEMESKCVSNSAQYDAAMCSDYIIEALVAQNELEEIDTTKIENYSKLGEGYLSPSYDPDNKWSVPYSGGGIGILVNRDEVTAEINSYADLWNTELEGQIAFTADERMALSICNLVNGNDFNATDESQIKAAGDKLSELMPNIHAFTYSGYKLMLNGEANVLVTASGDAYKAAKEMTNWQYINPSEGEHMYMDSYVIPKGADMDAAYTFINTIISKEYLTRKGADTNWGYGYTNLEVETDAKAAGISGDLLRIAYPAESVYDTAHYMTGIGDASLTYDEVWSEVKLKAGTKISSEE